MPSINIIDALREELEKKSNIENQISSQHYFKDKLKFYGIKNPDVNNIGKEYFKKIKDHPKKEIYQWCEALWQSTYFEESLIACNWSYYLHKEYAPEDIKLFEKWIDLYVNNWASCDTLCNHTIGTFIEMYPHFLTTLIKWTLSPNRWMRRASAVSLIVPAKKGLFLKEVFEISDKLLLDKEDLVQKGYGWLLKVAANKHQKEVFNFVMQHKAMMPRTALRYAIEKMPQVMKNEAMAK